MPTLNQLIRKEGKRGGRRKIPNAVNTVMNGSPQRGGTCLSVLVTTPKKPNSAKRKIAKVRLSKTGKVITAYIPGENHKLQTYARVLIRYKGPKDVPRCRTRIIPGPRDCPGVAARKKRRSVYGCKKA